jgi:hypothetical protein
LTSGAPTTRRIRRWDDRGCGFCAGSSAAIRRSPAPPTARFRQPNASSDRTRASRQVEIKSFIAAVGMIATGVVGLVWATIKGKVGQ